MHAHTRAHTHTHTHTYTHTHKHAHTHAHTHARTHIRTHIRTHMRTHTHTHKPTCISRHKAHTRCQFTAQKASPNLQHRLRCFPLLVKNTNFLLSAPKCQCHPPLSAFAFALLASPRHATSIHTRSMVTVICLCVVLGQDNVCVIVLSFLMKALLRLHACVRARNRRSCCLEVQHLHHASKAKLCSEISGVRSRLDGTYLTNPPITLCLVAFFLHLRVFSLAKTKYVRELTHSPEHGPLTI